MVIPKFGTAPAYLPRNRAFSNIQPFTYEDGLTYHDLLESMRAYIQNKLVPFIQEGLDTFAAEVIVELQLRIDRAEEILIDVEQMRDEANASAQAAKDSENSAADSATSANADADRSEDAYQLAQALADQLADTINSLVTDTELQSILTGYASATDVQSVGDRLDQVAGDRPTFTQLYTELESYVTTAGVQSAVNDAIANDSTVRDAAAAAVGGIVDDLDLLSASRALKDICEQYGAHALYDVTDPSSTTVNETSGNIVEVRDSMGNLSAITPSSAGTANIERSAFGYLSGFTGVLANFNDAHPQPTTVLLLARDTGKGNSGSVRNVMGGGSSSARFEAGINTDSEVFIGINGDANRRSGNTDEYTSGIHVWEMYYSVPQGTLSIDGALAHRGLPVWSETTGVSSMYFGANFVSSGSAVGEWGGSIGAIVVLRGNNDSNRLAINRIRSRMMSIAGIEKADPWWWPETRALSLDGYGRVAVSRGDPDEILSGGIASITKVVNALVAREYLTNESRLDTIVEVLPEDEFLTGNAPGLVAGDRCSYRVLLQSMLIPSNNVAPRTLARTIGETFAGSGSGQEKYLDRMQELMDERGYTNAYIANSNPGGGGRMSMWQIADAFRELMRDSVLADMVSTDVTSVDIFGDNARTVEVTNSWINRQVYEPIPEAVSSKDGTGTTAAGTVFQWNHPDGSVHTSVIQSFEFGVSGHTSAYENNKLIEADKNGRSFQPSTPAKAYQVNGGPVYG